MSQTGSSLGRKKQKGPADAGIQWYKMHYRNCFYKEFEAINLVVNRSEVKVDNKKKNPKIGKMKPLKRFQELKKGTKRHEGGRVKWIF